jgi:hypothetical protein
MGLLAPTPTPGALGGASRRSLPRRDRILSPPTALGRRARPVFGGGRRSSSVFELQGSSPFVEDADEDGALSCDLSDRDRVDRGLGLRRALSDETQSRPFQPLGGEVLHIGWMRTESQDTKVSRSEAEHDRECMEALLAHYTVEPDKQQTILDRVERGWSDVTLRLGQGYYCRLQRFSEFDTLTLSGPGNPDEAVDAPCRPWQWLLPPGWLAKVPGRVFLCCHVLARHAEPFVDESDVWTELDQVTRSVKWEDRVTAAELAEATMKETEKSLAREELLVSIAELEDNIVAGELNDSIDESVDEDDVLNRVESGARENANGHSSPAMTAEDCADPMGARAAEDARLAVMGAGGVVTHATNSAVVSAVQEECHDVVLNADGVNDGRAAAAAAAATTKEVWGGNSVVARIREGGDGTEKKKEKSDKKSKAKKAPSAAFGTEEWQKQQKSKRRREEKTIKESENGDSQKKNERPASRLPEWRTWSTQMEHSRIVAMSAGSDTRFYANYHIDQEGGMQCLLLTPRKASVVQAAFQLQRFLTIEQYRLLILARLPAAKARYPTLSKLNDQYTSVSRQLTRMNQGAKKGNFIERMKHRLERAKRQQALFETISDLEQATARELARAKSEAALVEAYVDIINTRFEEAEYSPVGGEVRFLPPFVRKRLDPAVSTIQSVAERAAILSNALQRTTGLLQAGVEVRMQRNYETMSLYALMFTIVGVIITAVTACIEGGALRPAFLAFCRWTGDVLAKAGAAFSGIGVA